MLIPKNKRTETVVNPHRPKIGVPREHSVCKVSWGTFYIEFDEPIERIKVDADHNEEFVAVLEATVPKEDRHRCTFQEVWLVDKKWKKFVVDTAREYFDEVKTELRKW